jgi:hypothetical protein
MKKYFSIITILFFILIANGCQDENAISPKASVQASAIELKINESVEFKFNGTAQKVSIFTGDESHNYDSIQSGNKGFVVNKGVFNYAYRHPGVYKVVIVASTSNERAVQLLHDTCSVTINVIDTIATIKSITCPKVFYDEIAAKNVDGDWLVCLPQKILFKGQTLPVSSKQRLAIKLASDSAKLLVNNAGFNATTTYELKNANSLSVKPYMGDTQNHNLYMLFYPEFKTFTLNGVAGTLVRSEYNYDKMQLSVTLPAGTDKKNLTPVFTLAEGQEVAVNGVLQTSGVSVVDFTSPVVFKLKNTSVAKPQLAAETNVTVTVL